jgi:hypothetical protein
MQSIRIHEVEVGRRYRFTFRHPVVEGARTRVLEAVVGASFWGEVPLHTKNGIVRIQRDDVVRVCACA